jgi:hypothetical protein
MRCRSLDRRGVTWLEIRDGGGELVWRAERLRSSDQPRQPLSQPVLVEREAGGG